MGLFDLFKRDLSNDPDLTRLRDLIIISASDSNYSLDENGIILNICRQEGIDIDKLQKLFKMNPEKIKDNYPTSLVEKSKYLRRLIEVMATDKVCYPQDSPTSRRMQKSKTTVSVWERKEMLCWPPMKKTNSFRDLLISDGSVSPGGYGFP